MKILPISITQAKDSYENFFVELYNIYLKSGELNICAADQDVVFNGKTYIAIPVERGTVRSSVDAKTDNMELTIANVDQGMTLALFQGFDFRGVDVELFKILYPDALTNPGLFIPVFNGYMDAPIIDNKKFKVTIKAKLPNHDFPNRRTSLCCNASFGDPDDCGVVVSRAVGTVGAGSTNGQIVDALRTEAANFWQYGIIQIGGEARKTKSFVDGMIVLDYPFLVAPEVGASYKIQTGCDKSFAMCQNKYHNGQNFSGFPAIPFEMVIKS